jgi:hypothetical protein
MFGAQFRFISRGNMNVYRRKKNPYPCVPEYQKVTPRDPFDYPLRSKAEVVKEFEMNNPTIYMHAQYNDYAGGDLRPESNPANMDNRHRVSKLYFDIRNFRLAPLQRNRFQYLLGPRWNPQKPHHLKIVSSRFPTFEENYVNGLRTLREIYWEAKRAPDTNHTFKVNPYRRDKLIKKFFGKTAEERRAFRDRIKLLHKERVAELEREKAEKEIQAQQEQKQLSEKRRGHGRLRKQLGFKDDTEEVDDPVLDKLEYDDALFQKAQKEKRDRKVIKMPTEIEGITRKEQYESVYQDKDAFKPI